MEKRAQFFIIAAFVIVGIIIGLSAVYTAIKVQQEERWVYDLSKEVNQETAQVINQGTIAEVNEIELENRIKGLFNNYSDSYPDSEIVVVYGKGGDNKLALYYKCKENTISVEGAGITSCIKEKEPRDLVVEGEVEGTRIEKTGNKVKIDLNGTQVGNIDATEDSYFYIVIKSTRGTVATTEQ